MPIQLKKPKVNVPSGSYFGKLSKVEPCQSQYGDGLRWSFTISRGEHQGKSLIGTTSTEPTAKNRLGKWLETITGKSLDQMASESESFDENKYFGQELLLTVKASDKGNSYVDAIARAPSM